MFFEMDERLLLACQTNFQEEEKKRAASEERRRLVWEHLERNAAFHPVTGDIGFAVPPTSAPLVAPTMTWLIMGSDVFHYAWLLASYGCLVLHKEFCCLCKRLVPKSVINSCWFDNDTWFFGVLSSYGHICLSQDNVQFYLTGAVRKWFISLEIFGWIWIANGMLMWMSSLYLGFWWIYVNVTVDGRPCNEVSS